MRNEPAMSAFQRVSYLEQLAKSTVDLLVIGGGVTGAGIALDAAARGLTVGLVEKQDFASGTSSRSTKLVHGGLRYLKQGDIQLVREVGRERAILHRNAPHIVIPEKMILPIVEKGTYGKLATSVGLYVYDLLAGVKRNERRKMLSKQETLLAEPLLRHDILKGSGLYYEYRTDDARLTIEVLKTASAYGAICLNYTEATDFIFTNGRVTGIIAKDQVKGKAYTLTAKKIVNATGPWVDRLREKDQSLSGKRLHLTKGVHLVVPYDRLPLRQAVYFDVADKRMIFAIPRNRSTYIGTTDTNYQGELERPSVTRQDVDYLLQAVNDMFPNVQLTEKDITSSWAGLRPLIHEDGKSPSELSRKDEVFFSHSGLITIAGGKLTGFRKMAERVVDIVAGQLAKEEGRVFKSCSTHEIVLAGGAFSSAAVIPAYIREQVQRLHAAGERSFDETVVTELVGKYGSNTEKIITSLIDLRNQGRQQEEAMNLAELQYGIQEEMVVTLRDFLIRRTGKLFFERESIQHVYGKLANSMARRFNWTARERESEVKLFEAEYAQVKTFY
ncbi:glycerol-3-phosphate dehydrogenase/oxidase [Brevibacillus centrosporus]|uniref:glycerol-3-phosphate dehydrogenase/oxidase n=1 Tax=Brevibacillus centrosporus TaxID=54910 RepID=UPI002E1EB4FF|nr:glycerol-3-phosphate dehydrogenase/oxidase [Brevibacillus centrosporus]